MKHSLQPSSLEFPSSKRITADYRASSSLSVGSSHVSNSISSSVDSYTISGVFLLYNHACNDTNRFVTQFPPSKTPNIENGQFLHWISVSNPNHSILHYEPDITQRDIDDFHALLAPILVAKTKKEARKNAVINIKNIATTKGLVSGKFLISKSISKIDGTWAKIVPAIVDGRLGTAAKVSTFEPASKIGPVICVYCPNFNDTVYLTRVSDCLKKELCLDPEIKLLFKPDFYTHIDFILKINGG